MTTVADVVSRGQKVFVKVLSFTGNKTSLSMKVSTAQLSTAQRHGNTFFQALRCYFQLLLLVKTF